MSRYNQNTGGRFGVFDESSSYLYNDKTLTKWDMNGLKRQPA